MQHVERVLRYLEHGDSDGASLYVLAHLPQHPEKPADLKQLKLWLNQVIDYLCQLRNDL